MKPISRRRVLALGSAGVGAAALTAVGIETDLLPGRVRLREALGLNGPATPPLETSARLVRGSFDSRARKTSVGWAIAYPSSHQPGDRLPVLVGLHGRFSTHTNLFGMRIGLDRYLAADPNLRFAIAAADGGDTYWHPRRSGEDAGAMITDEFLPLLADRGLSTERIGLYGFSMGGYGALRLAGLLGPDRVSAVVAISAALFASAADTAPGAFDDAEDFATHDVMGRQAQLDGIPVRVDCGNGDPFKPAVKDYRDGFSADRRPAGGFEAGGHNDDYWRRMAPAELAFVGEHLTG